MGHPRERGDFGQVRSEFPVHSRRHIDRAPLDRCIRRRHRASRRIASTSVSVSSCERIEVDRDRTVADDDIAHAAGKTSLDRVRECYRSRVHRRIDALRAAR